MNTTPKRSKTIMTMFCWGPTVEEAMREAHNWEKQGWVINGNPAPMTWDGEHGTGVSISTTIVEDEE